MYGRVVFVARDLARLDLVRPRTLVADGHATSAEQTIVDLARRPARGGGQGTVREAITRLLPRADQGRLDEFAAAQRGQAAIARVRAAQAELGA